MEDLLQKPGKLAHAGRIEDRRFVWDYVSVARHQPGAQWKRLDWTAETPGRTAVRLQVRTADSEAELAHAPWLGASGPGSHFTQPGSSLTQIPQEAWIQYRVELDTANGATSPGKTTPSA